MASVLLPERLHGRSVYPFGAAERTLQRSVGVRSFCLKVSVQLAPSAPACGESLPCPSSGV